MAETFEDWLAQWKRLKSAKGTPIDIEAVSAQWRIHPPIAALEVPCLKITGSRKNYKSPRGKQKIEALLLGEKGRLPRPRKISGSIISELRVYAIFNNFAGAKIKKEDKGQLMPDAFGVLRVGNSYHLLVIEVKVADGNCWSAVVQNLQQARFFRSMGQDVQQAIAEYSSNFIPNDTKLSGVWGLVLAPPNYWRAEKRLNEALQLMTKLTENTADGSSETNPRILLAAIDDVGIRLVGGQKLSKNRSH